MYPLSVSAVAITVLFASMAQAQITTFPVNSCLSGKMAAVGKSASARIKCYSEDAATGATNADCHDRASRKFTGDGDASRSPFGKLEARYPGSSSTPCLTYMDQSTLESDIADFAAGLPALTGSAPGECDAAKLRCIAKYVGGMGRFLRGVAKCDAKAAATGESNADCVAKTAAKLADGSKGCLDKAASSADCTNAGSQATELSEAAATFWDGVRCTLSPGNDGCPTCSYAFADDYTAISVLAPASTAATSTDWRTRGVVTPVQDQGPCGSDGAFSANAAVEVAIAIQQGTLQAVSEQEILDCASAGDCAGVSPVKSFAYQQASGVCSDAAYPYTASQGTCQSTCSALPYSRISGLDRIPAGDEATLKAYVYQGAVAAVVRGGSWLDNYTSGIADPECDSCGPGNERPYYAVTIVGFGEELGVPYWLLKSSKGTGFGESGYVRLRADRNACGVADFALVPRP